ncbi:hypothetical protein TPHA_0A05730 [Tetrapisispora phaffii CBS 4417]|uniref:Nuclear control of ATPase protein 2 n=1 Tax=Tetrapisispora phaffii (strain ATCC 24235 / CBS 4417 / NBRC 1672 / NRRL Y-8282 / UCD 70-5) TaxID=1071381 RepID=G8BP19_TETPH|nr:hypothetical protein TPHA_0A05730 [Tetrapisispora phaffii CBS 4417]CCE61647.1 hypothetical protein TPHA_0A05730 [Tetrapisispora phaffii CBS 4417]
MITDSFVVQSIQEVTSNLEKSLQSLVFPDNESENVVNSSLGERNLEVLQNQLSEIKNLSENLCKQISGRKTYSNLNIDFGKIQEILLKIDELPKSSNYLQNIITAGISHYVLIICYYCLTNTLVNQLVRVNNVKSYYESVSSSKLYSLFYGLQILPSELYYGIKAVSNKIRSKVSDLKSVQTSLTLEDVKCIGTDIAKDIYPQFNKLLMVQSFKFVGLPRETTKKVQVLFSLPHIVLKNKLHNQLNLTDSIHERYLMKLGYLICNVQKSKEEKLLDAKLNYFKTFFEIDSNTNKTLSDIVKLTSNFKEANELTKIQKPSILVRIWPVTLLTLMYGPSSISSLWHNRIVIADFIRANLIEFVSGLLYNWIWQPLKQVWATVRHDENSSIAMMSQDTLPSELNSLNRMVVSLVSENSSSNIDVDSLVSQVEHGDLTQFMEIYENQLENPVKNIVTGKLIRSLLVQVQKTKVDGSLVLDGVDKMLKSQQLVFGVLALSPAIAIVYFGSVAACRLVKLGNIWSNIQTYKLAMIQSLNSTERLISLMEDTEVGQKAYYEQGLLTVELNILEKVGYILVEPERRKEWLRDITELGNLNNTTSLSLRIINRINRSYSKYL